MKRYWYIWSFALGVAPLVVMACANHFSSNAYSPNINDPDPAVRADAVRNGSFRAKDALNDEDADVRILAVWHLGDDYQDLVPFLKDDHAGVRMEAAKALRGEKAWPVIKVALSDPDPRIRKGAIQAILNAQMDWKEQPFWPTKKGQEIGPIFLKMANEDPDAGVRLFAKEAHKEFMAWKR